MRPGPTPGVPFPMSGSDLTDKPHPLLADACVQPGERVLDLGAGGKPLGTDLAGREAEVCFIASDIRDIRLCDNKISDLHATNIRTVLDGSSQETPRGPFDVARLFSSVRLAMTICWLCV